VSSTDHSAAMGMNTPATKRNPVTAGLAVGRPIGVRGPVVGGTRSTHGHAPSRLYAVRARELWNFIKRQPKSFLFVCFYLFMEYVRPQQIWTSIAGPPYSKFIIGFAVVAFVLEGRPLRMKVPEIMLGVFTVIILASSFLAVSPAASFDNISVYLSWIVAYVLIANTADTEERFLVFTLSFILYSAKMAQHGVRSWASDGFAFRNWGINGAPGWFSNSGEFALQMCIFLPIVIYFSRSLGRDWPRWKRYVFWAMPGAAVISIVGSSSRGALVGLAAVAIWMLLKSRYKFRALIGIAVLAASVYWLLPQQQLERLQNMGGDETSVSRTTLWAHGREMLDEHPTLGIGYFNWSPYSRVHYGSDLLPHNIFVQAGAELGYVGLVAFVALIFLTFAINYRTRQLTKHLPEGERFMFEMAHGLDAALVAFLACGFFVTVLFYPFFWINLAMSVALYNAAAAAGVPVTLPRGRRMAQGRTAVPNPPVRRGAPVPVRSPG
jgi:putative inorganic carbon (HCO3(-)) transporter